jgi:hypothetical protein
MKGTRSRVQFPQSRLAPKEVIQRLREIDPAAELVYFGQGRWVLGVYRPNQARINAAYRRLAFLSHVTLNERARDPMQEARLATTGFRPIEWYTVQGEPGAEIVEDFRLRDFNWRNRADEVFAHALGASDRADAAKDRAAEDLAEAKAGDAWRWAFKRPHSVS